MVKGTGWNWAIRGGLSTRRSTASLTACEMVTDPIFGFAIPKVVPGVPSDILIPRNTWKNPAAYDERARDLVARFHKYMEQFAAVHERRGQSRRAQSAVNLNP